MSAGAGAVWDPSHRRGAVWWADLPEPVGAGPGFRRPVVNVSGDPFNASAIRTVVAVLLTSNQRLADAPGNVRVGAREAGLPRESVANVSQVYTLDKTLLADWAGQLRPAIDAACRRAGYVPPVIATPDELMGDTRR